jgi:hypothetical protein
MRVRHDHVAHCLPLRLGQREPNTSGIDGNAVVYQKTREPLGWGRATGGIE